MPFGIGSSHQTRAAAPTASKIDIIDPVRVTLADLVRLAPLARQLELWQEKESESGGGHHTVFKGRGMEFAETRPYQPGDDIRHIDWRVTARSGRAHTKLFREERERPVMIWIDLRPSMFFATRGLFKSVLAARLAALIAWIANTHGDRVGGRVLSEFADNFLTVARGRSAVLRFLRAVEQGFGTANGGTQTQVSAVESLQLIRKTIRPGSCVFLISDFNQIASASIELLRSIGSHSQVTLCHIYDQLESSLPPPGVYPIAASDGQTAILDSATTDFRSAYQQRFSARVEQLRGEAVTYRARYLSFATTDDSIEVLRGVGHRARLRA